VSKQPGQDRDRHPTATRSGETSSASPQATTAHIVTTRASRRGFGPPQIFGDRRADAHLATRRNKSTEFALRAHVAPVGAREDPPINPPSRATWSYRRARLRPRDIRRSDPREVSHNGDSVAWHVGDIVDNVATYGRKAQFSGLSPGRSLQYAWVTLASGARMDAASTLQLRSGCCQNCLSTFGGAGRGMSAVTSSGAGRLNPSRSAAEEYSLSL